MSITEVSKQILSETIISYAQAARRLPPGRNGRPTSPATIWRWTREGVRSAAGSVVILESCRIGGRSVTSVEALARFSAALSGQAASETAHADTVEVPTPRTPAQRQRDAERAGDLLQQSGV